MSLTLTIKRGEEGVVSGSGTAIELEGTISGGGIESLAMYGSTEQSGTPSPSSPKTIQTAAGRQTITISDSRGQSQAYEINLGKNLFDKDTAPECYFYINGNTLNSYTVRPVSTYIEIQPNTTYTVTKPILQNNRFGIGTCSVTPVAGITLTSSIAGNNSKYLTITSGANDRYLVIYFKQGGDTTPNTTIFNQIQVEVGSSASSYAPYFTPIELCEVGSYQDYIYYDSGVWYLHKEVGKIASYDSETVTTDYISTTGELTAGATVYYGLTASTNTPITVSALITQLEALYAAKTYNGTSIFTVSSNTLVATLAITVETYVEKIYTEVDISSPFTISDVEGKSSNTTLDGNVYVDWAYNKKQYSFNLFNLTPQDYEDIRAFYDYQFSNSAFPTITVPELNIERLPVYMEISSRNIVNQCLLTDKLTLKFRETVQP